MATLSTDGLWNLLRGNTIRKLVNIKKNRQHETYQSINNNVLSTIEPAYPEWMKDQGFTRKTCEHFGIGYGMYGQLNGRVCFPIDAPDGTIISISGRMPYCDGANISRYHIIGHSVVKNTLYNISRINKNIIAYSQIFVVEGFKSVMRLYQEGYENAVATVGASLSDTQKNLLLKTGLPITVIADNDKAGECFAQSVYNKCYKFSDVKIIKLSEITGKPKASVDDLDFDEFLELEERM